MANSSVRCGYNLRTGELLPTTIFLFGHAMIIVMRGLALYNRAFRVCITFYANQIWEFVSFVKLCFVRVDRFVSFFCYFVVVLFDPVCLFFLSFFFLFFSRLFSSSFLLFCLFVCLFLFVLFFGAHPAASLSVSAASPMSVCAAKAFRRYRSHWFVFHLIRPFHCSADAPHSSSSSTQTVPVSCKQDPTPAPSPQGAPSRKVGSSVGEVLGNAQHASLSGLVH